MPTVLTLGIAYNFYGTFLTALDLEASSSGHNNLRFGMEYKAYGNFYARGGLMSNPAGLSFGLGYSGRVFQGDLGFITHTNLGLTPSLSIVFLI